MDADGNNVRRLTNDPGLDTMPAFSPTGNRIAFSSNRDGEHPHEDFDIYLLDLTDEGGPGPLRRLTNSPGPEMHVRFSPDGEWIVYTSKRGGFNDELELSFTESGQTYGEIYAQRIDDGLVVRLTHNKWEDGPVDWGRAAQSTRGPGTE
jgi:Tol biopolymer transport system component